MEHPRHEDIVAVEQYPGYFFQSIRIRDGFADQGDFYLFHLNLPPNSGLNLEP
jgi:hypothetical protein